MKVTALIPAHNEEAQIAECVRALSPQVDCVIVVADNCSDNTIEEAKLAGARVFETVGNRHKKAGALNQVLSVLLPTTEAEAILVVDADSTLAPDFVEQAKKRLRRRYAAVGGNFRGKPGGGLVGAFQRNEYARYARDVARRKGRCLVLTGTATLFNTDALRAVSGSRENGDVYDTDVLTEDNELTLRIMHLGMKVISPKECTLTTEVMPTWGDLARQRLRWKRGAIQNLTQYGWTPITRAYWGRQALGVMGVLVTFAYLVSLAVAPFLGLTLQPFWLALTGIFAFERAITVHERGWRHMLFGATVIPEFVYDMFLQFVQARAYLDAALGKQGRW